MIARIVYDGYCGVVGDSLLYCLLRCIYIGANNKSNGITPNSSMLKKWSAGGHASVTICLQKVRILFSTG